MRRFIVGAVLLAAVTGAGGCDKTHTKCKQAFERWEKAAGSNVKGITEARALWFDICPKLTAEDWKCVDDVPKFVGIIDCPHVRELGTEYQSKHDKP